jgi:hypothetical protein
MFTAVLPLTLTLSPEYGGEGIRKRILESQFHAHRIARLNLVF